MSLTHLRPHLSERVQSHLRAQGWDLLGGRAVDGELEEAERNGWAIFPLAAEFLRAFDGLCSSSDEEICAGAWKAFSREDLSHPSLNANRAGRPLFPVGVAAGWVPILLADDGAVFCSVNGQISPLYPDGRSVLETLVINILKQREAESRGVAP